MKQCSVERRERFGIRKFALGACSVVIGASLFGYRVAADQIDTGEGGADPLREVLVLSETEDKSGAEAGQGGTEVVETATMPSEEAGPSELAMPKSETVEDKAEAKANDSSEVEKPLVTVADFPEIEDQGIRPKEIKFDSWDEVLAWEPGARPDDDVNRGSVKLVERFRGHVVNEKANEKAKVEALSNTNSKAKDHASVGGEEFKAYAFDYWQYLDSMVFWEGLVPTPDVIDAGHRNGVPVLGTIFYNWSGSIADQEKFVASMKQDPDGTFPVARKLVDMAKYYGFDGYFINQETTGHLVQPLGETMRRFMVYTKEYAESVGYPISYSWYDAMTYEHGRYHTDSLSEYNAKFMEKDGKHVPADRFFANFNWTKSKNDTSVATAERINRDQFDVFAGLELQRGGSYNTHVNWRALFDDKGKLRLSLGLFAPDTITSLGKTGEDYHEHENIFFTGYQGDPTKQKPADKDWYGLANLVADKTAIISRNFNSSFNTGHGKKWFVDGKLAKDGEWNYRSVAGILPTWRWWIESTGAKLKAAYDFDDAYNGGNSLRFSGDLAQSTKQEIKLYSTKIPLSDKSKLRVAHKGGQGAKVSLALALEPDYQFANQGAWKELTLGQDWQDQTFDLSALAGQTVYGIQLLVENAGALSGFDFHLGQLSIYDQDQLPASPSQGEVIRKRLKNAQEAEAVIQFKGTADADYYEVYAQDEGQWKLLTGSSSTTIYLPALTRSAGAEGRKQALKIHAIGKNGLRSEAGNLVFDWGMTVKDTSLPKAAAKNIVLGAQVIGSSFAKKDSGEGIEGMLNGTITSLSDKWSSHQLSGTVDIRLTQPRTVVRWAMDHAGAGGESINDGLMNTKDFDLYYKNEAGEWTLAKAVRGNRAHVTDLVLDQPIRAQDWRLHVLTSDNGTPWKAIRIYNWRMYEELDRETENVPMAQAHARHLGNKQVQVAFKDVAGKRTIALYRSPMATEPLAQLEVTEAGDVLFDPIRLEQLPEFLYYRSREAGKDWSNWLAISLPQGEKTITGLELERPLTKKVYRQGQALSLAGASLRVHFDGAVADESINLSNPAVKVTGFDPQRLGEQVLQVSYLGEKLAQPLVVYVVDKVSQGDKKPLGLVIEQLPKTDYFLGEGLDLAAGRFALLFDDETSQVLSFSDDKVVVDGFDTNKEGRQQVTLSYAGLSTHFDVLVSPKPIVNDEYLRQKMAEVQDVQGQTIYLYASKDKQEAVVRAMEFAQAVVANQARTVEEVEAGQTLLGQAISQLDGKEAYDKDLAALASLIQQTKGLKKATSSEELAGLLAMTEQLVKSNQVRPEQMADLLARWTALFEELSLVTHVGSTNPAEQGALLAPDKPRLELVFVTKPRDYIEIARPDLPVGHKELVAEGEDGQLQMAYLIYSDGRSELYSQTLIRDSQPQIVAVGLAQAEMPSKPSDDSLSMDMENDLDGQDGGKVHQQEGQKMSQQVMPEVKPEPAMGMSKEPVATASKVASDSQLPETGDSGQTSLTGLGLVGLLGLAGLALGKKEEE